MGDRSQQPPQYVIQGPNPTIRLIIETPGALATLRVLGVLFVLAVILMATAQHFDETELRTLGILLVVLAGGETLVAGAGRKWLGIGKDEERIKALERELEIVKGDNERLKARIAVYEDDTKQL